jgi:carbamoyl-phosphate synthase/aspartate carbamoyltransferase
MAAADKGVLHLADGSLFEGTSFGSTAASVSGELVFQTGMVGYPESLTDPSYAGQILVITFPLVGNYGVPSEETPDPIVPSLPKHFESAKIHVAGLIVGIASEDYSHYLAKSSLGEWLKSQGIPALTGIDTRALTKRIRDAGSMLARLLLAKTSSSEAPLDIAKESEFLQPLSWVDPNKEDLVARVSRKTPQVFAPAASATTLKTSSGRPLTIMAVDLGMKNNQIRCFVSRGVTLKVVPHDYDFVADQDSYDGLFLSNGPGDPTMCQSAIKHTRTLLAQKTKPIFGICLGHQILALASGASTQKLKFGNRGHNIPCTDLATGRCYITSQNHGFAVDVSTLTSGWTEYFVNANDGSNEGIKHTTLPFFSVQFHPESAPGPWDTEFLFDKFIKVVQNCVAAGTLVSIPSDGEKPESKKVTVRKVLILGSGGLSIGQAGEFDYSGSQVLFVSLVYQVLYSPLLQQKIGH